MNWMSSQKLIKFSKNLKSYCKNYSSIVNRHTNHTSHPRSYDISSFNSYKSTTPFPQQRAGVRPRSIYYEAENEAKQGSCCDPADTEELTSFKKGDMLNLSDLLFTKNRDYLIKCNNGQRVKAEQLLGKVVVLYFDSVAEMSVILSTSLMHIYKELQPNSNFEVVFVDVNDSYGTEILYCEDMISRMPWTAIPLSDITCRKHLKRRIGLRESSYIGYGYPIIVDSTGMILQCHGNQILLDYGALGYPFSDERIDFLKSEDAAAARQPSLHTLLASSNRDYLISNKGDKVPIHTLEDKVVALYFYEEGFSDEKITEELEMAYKELARNNKKFEVVLIYRFDGQRTWGYKSDESFWKTFKTMPWLALPNDDSHHRMLKRVFNFPCDHDGQEFSLIIIGPRMGFIEPFGVFILQNFKISAYPFSLYEVAKLITKETKELRLKMLWDPNSVFGGKFGSEVLFSQLAGKRVIIYFDWGYLCVRDTEFLMTLKERYIHMKGTDDEFEVIHITKLCTDDKFGGIDIIKLLCLKTEHVTNLPWFVLPLSKDYNECLSILFDLSFFQSCCPSLIAFDRDGRVVRKTVSPMFEDIDFPFYAGDLEKEALSQLLDAFSWNMFSNFPIYSYKQEEQEKK